MGKVNSIIEEFKILMPEVQLQRIKFIELTLNHWWIALVDTTTLSEHVK